MAKKSIQEPKDGHVSVKANLRARIDGNLIRDERLAERGWEPVQASSSTIGHFLHRFNSVPNRKDVTQLFNLIHADCGSFAEQNDLALQFAGEILPADITVSDVVDLLQQSRTWSFDNSMECRMNVIKALNNLMVINPQTGMLPFGMTPLSFAALGGNPAAVRLLLSKGARVDHMDEYGHTPLIAASFLGHTNVVKVLLQHGRAEIDRRGRKDLRTALSHAAQWTHVEVVRVLLDRGANPRLQGQCGRTAVSMAATCPRREILEMILISGRADSRTPDHEGRSPLVHAKSELEVLRQKHQGGDDMEDRRAIIGLLEERDICTDEAVEDFVTIELRGQGY